MTDGTHSPATSVSPPSQVAIVGAGTMGHGIAYVAAVAGYHVRLTDASADVLPRALEHVRAALDKGVARGKVTGGERHDALARVMPVPELAEAVRDAGIVIEAVPERLSLKQELFAQLDRVAPRDALLATNTSSLSVSTIASAVARPARVIGMHFFNPVPAMRLVELVRGGETSDDTVAAAQAFVQAIGKAAIVVHDSPGFATSRLGVVLGLEAMRMLEQGVASAADIDTAMELGYNHPVGPLKLTDIVGLDVRLAVADHLYEQFHSDIYAPPDLLRRMVAEGKLGKKSGQGFYRWGEER